MVVPIFRLHLSEVSEVSATATVMVTIETVLVVGHLTILCRAECLQQGALVLYLTVMTCSSYHEAKAVDKRLGVRTCLLFAGLVYRVLTHKSNT